MGPQFIDTDFGGRGCLESLAGLGPLRVRARDVVADSPTWLDELFRAAARGSEPARVLVHDVAALVGIAAANVCSVLDPSLLVLGGSLVAAGPSLIEEVRRIVARTIPTPPRIVPTSLEKDAPLLGSVIIATAEAREHLRQEIAERRNGG